MTEDGPSRRGGNDEINHRQRHRSDIEANGVVDPQSTERRAASPRDQFRHEIAHRVGEQREHQSADDVPTRYIEVFETARKEWRQELDDGDEERQDNEGVNDQRKFRPFEGLAESSQD